MEKACTKCGEVKALSEYRNSNKSQCKVCLSASDKAYREANKEKIAACSKAYYEANKEKRATSKKAYYEANKEKIAASRRAHYEANKEIEYAHSRKRRAIKRQAYVPRCDYWKQIEVEMGEKRRELQEQAGVSYHIDHIYPLSKGGIDHPVNYQILTAKENLGKHDKVDSDCPQQAKLGLISRLVLEEGIDVNEAIKLTEEVT